MIARIDQGWDRALSTRRDDRRISRCMPQCANEVPLKPCIRVVVNHKQDSMVKSADVKPQSLGGNTNYNDLFTLVGISCVPQDNFLIQASNKMNQIRYYI